MGYERDEFRLVAGSLPNRKDVSVEIGVGKIQLADVYDDPGYTVVEFCNLKEPAIAVKVDDIQDLLRRAVEILASRPRKQ